MTKLITLQGFLNLSSGAVKMIEQRLKEVDLEENCLFEYDDQDEFIEALAAAVDAGDTVVCAAENEEYNTVKGLIIAKFGLKSDKNADVAKVVSEGRGARTGSNDVAGHCNMPTDAEVYLSSDGLYSGFCVEFSNGARVIYLPLDETRLDTLLSYVESELSPKEQQETEAQPKSQEAAETHNGSDATDGSDDVNEEDEAPIIMRDGESYEIDDSADEADLSGFDEALSAAARCVNKLIHTDKKVAFVNTQVSAYLNAMAKKIDGLDDCFEVCDPSIDNEADEQLQIALAKKTRLAMRDTGAPFGAAISSIIQDERDGKPFWYAYIIIHDGASAKAKKVSTSSKQGIDNLIPHAFAVMFQLIAQKAELFDEERAEIEQEESGDNKKRVALLVFAILGAVAAIACAVLMVAKYFSTTGDLFTTTSDPNQTISTGDTMQSTDPTSTTQPTSSLNQMVSDANLAKPAEPTAGDITNTQTAPIVSSTQGMFTFTVYGYGHGVGMSQTGANYYASIGKTYLEILAIYYYGASLVIGAPCPETVNYGGNTYATRDYLATVVESEMGSSYNLEALKAQAVAAYTFAKYNDFNLSITAHAFDKTPSENAYKAVDAVMGQYIVYNGEVCETFYHATSAGKTTSYANAFGNGELPYLAGGRPSYGDVTVENYMTTVTYTSEELKALVYSKTGIQLTGDPANWFRIISHDGCINNDIGYVAYIQVGDKVYTGYKFRLDVLGGAIRSHCFTFTYTPTA